MPFQTTVGNMPAAGLVAEKSRLGILEDIKIGNAADAYVKLGNFVYASSNAGEVKGHGAAHNTAVIGLAVGRTLQPQLIGSSASGMGVVQGQFIQYAESGEYCVVSSTAAALGDKVLSDGVTGKIATGSSTTVGEETWADTGWVVTDIGGTGAIGSILRIKK